MLPPNVQVAVRSRRRALARRARGAVLDLGGAESHGALWPDLGVTDVVVTADAASDPGRELSALADSGARFDTVFSVFRMAAVADLDELLDRVRHVLTDDGRLLFLEPARRGGSLGPVQRLLAPGITLATGWRVDRDIPATLRAAGLSVTDIERHRTSTVQWWLRSLIEGAAHRALAPSGLNPR